MAELSKQQLKSDNNLDFPNNNIGAITPDEIALSLVAEIRASLSGREGGFLRLRKTSIHERK